jgi:hypothetical protein
MTMCRKPDVVPERRPIDEPPRFGFLSAETILHVNLGGKQGTLRRSPHPTPRHPPPSPIPPQLHVAPPPLEDNLSFRVVKHKDHSAASGFQPRNTPPYPRVSASHIEDLTADPGTPMH